MSLLSADEELKKAKIKLYGLLLQKIFSDNADGKETPALDIDIAFVLVSDAAVQGALEKLIKES